MFGKKKETGLAVQHYEGISQFAVNQPCTINLDADVLTIKRIKPETTVTLPVNRINSISALKEEQFMQTFHGNAENTSKMKNANKDFLVIQYDKRMLAFWNVNKIGDFMKLQNHFNETSPTSISL